MKKKSPKIMHFFILFLLFSLYFFRILKNVKKEKPQAIKGIFIEIIDEILYHR